MTKYYFISAPQEIDSVEAETKEQAVELACKKKGVNPDDKFTEERKTHFHQTTYRKATKLFNSFEAAVNYDMYR